VVLQIYEYDTTGRLKRVITRSPGSSDRVVESYEYDPPGHKRKTLYVDLASQRPDTHYFWGVEGTDSSYSAPGATTLTTLYNERDQPTALLFHDSAGRLLSRVDFGYQEAGNLVEEAQTNMGETLPPEMAALLNSAQLATVRTLFGAAGEPIRRIHSYDGQGRRVGTRTRMGPLGGDSKTVAYNDRGDPIEEALEHDQRGYSIDDAGRLSDAPSGERVSRSEAHFRYDYDARGNWVVKTVESRGAASQDFTLFSFERRTIEYFT
jgi:hypothetical protein